MLCMCVCFACFRNSEVSKDFFGTLRLGIDDVIHSINDMAYLLSCNIGQISDEWPDRNQY